MQRQRGLPGEPMPVQLLDAVGRVLPQELADFLRAEMDGPRTAHAIPLLIAPQLLGKTGFGVEQAPGRHRHEAAEHEGRQENHTGQTGDVMQFHHAPIWACALLPVTPDTQPHQADDQAAQHRGQTHQRNRDQQIPPHRIVLAQLHRVNPVQVGAKPVPHPLIARHIADHLARARRDIKPGCGFVPQRHLVQRPVGIQRAGNRPLIHLQRALMGNFNRFPIILLRLIKHPGGIFGILGFRFFEPLAGVRVKAEPGLPRLFQQIGGASGHAA